MATNGHNPLLELKQLGQSIWLDSIRRGHILSGGLKKMIDDDGLSGETANPSIFEKAIGESHDYDDAIRKLVDTGKSALEIYETLAVEDVRMACDVFRPTYDATKGADGFVSIEVSPKLAHDTPGTIAEAKRFFKAVNRPNVLIKIPGTKEGVPAIEECLYQGININVTLLFAVQAYEEVVWAYIRALERRAKEGKPIDRTASVASFFVSRIDTLADKLLAEKMKTTTDPEISAKLEALGGKAAIANAKMAYALFKRVFSDPRFLALKQKGARVQRPLWASTSTKNPHYPDTLYVDTLVGPDTVNTLPVETIDAYLDHGKPHASIEEDMDLAHQVLRDLDQVGVSLDQVTQQVLDEGVVKFDEALEKLLGSIESKIVAAASKRHCATLGGYQQVIDADLAAAVENRVAARVWNKDAALWKTEPAHQAIIQNALGWLTVPSEMQKHVEELRAFGAEIKNAGFKFAVLCGMGGSSLCVEVCRDTFGSARGYPRLFVLDTTDPASLRALERKIKPAQTLFIIASKSSETTETLSHFKYFAARAPAENFVAITDAGSGLEKLAREKGFRCIFLNPSDIGGRYSALSYFGLVPAAVMGIDFARLLDRAEEMAHACGANVKGKDNPGLWLGVVLAALAQKGRDKITLSSSPDIGTFGAWAEQLIAESTGKEGKGLVPVEGEPLGAPSTYGQDRVFVHMQVGKKSDASVARKLQALEKAGQPIVNLQLRDLYDVGAEFFRWEFAVAVAGALIGIDAFDQPNVQESKDNTKRVLQEQASAERGGRPEDEPGWENKNFAVYSTTPLAGVKDLRGAFKNLLALAHDGDYFAVMAYLERAPATSAALKSLRVAVRDQLKIATTVGYGPRFLHSTGQLHKGGRNSFLGLQITAEDAVDALIPGEPYSFSVLKRAQAAGDWQSLTSHGRRALRVHLKRAAGLSAAVREMKAALGVQTTVRKAKTTKRKSATNKSLRRKK